MLKSLYLRTAKIKIYRQKVCCPQKLELSEESLQMGSPNWFYSHVYFWQFLNFLLHYYHFFLWIILYSCFSNLRTWGCIHKLWFDDLWWHVAWRVQFRWTMHKFKNTFAFRIHAKQEALLLVIFKHTGWFSKVKFSCIEYSKLAAQISALECDFSVVYRKKHHVTDTDLNIFTDE